MEPVRRGFSLMEMVVSGILLSTVILLVAGVALFRPDIKGGEQVDPHSCAVTDLQFLDKNSDVLQNLEVLDDIQDGSPAVTANQ